MGATPIWGLGAKPPENFKDYMLILDPESIVTKKYFSVVSVRYIQPLYRIKKTTTTSSTNPLWYHLKAAHSIATTEKLIPAAKKPKVQQGLITIFVDKKSQQEMYSQLAGAGRLSFNQIARSQFITSAMQDKKLIAHSSPIQF